MDEELEKQILHEYSSSRCWNQSFIFRIKGIPIDLSSSCGANPTTPVLVSQDPKLFQQPKNYPPNTCFRFPKSFKGIESESALISAIKDALPGVDYVKRTGKKGTVVPRINLFCGHKDKKRPDTSKFKEGAYRQSGLKSEMVKNTKSAGSLSSPQMMGGKKERNSITTASKCTKYSSNQPLKWQSNSFKECKCPSKISIFMWPNDKCFYLDSNKTCLKHVGHGEAERRADGRLAYGAAFGSRQLTLYHSGERRESPAKKRRGSYIGAGGGSGAEKSPPKRVKDGAVYPPSLKVKIGNMGAGLQMDEQKNQFYLTPCAPLDRVPLVSSLSSDRSKKLPPPLQSLLQQIEFFNLSSLALTSGEKVPPPDSVGIRCQNCVSGPDGCGFVRLTSTEELPSDLIAMAADHLVYCRCTEPSARARLKCFTVQDPKPFEEYCRRISKMYGLEDSTSNNVSVVVWGECPSIPSGYFGSPKNIDVDFALDLSHSTEEKEEFSSRSGTEVSSSALLATEKAGA